MPAVKKPAKNPATDCCPHCGSTEDPYWSRIVPMGYFCPDCGKDQNEPPAPPKPPIAMLKLPPHTKAPWVAHNTHTSPCSISPKAGVATGHKLAKVFLTDPATKKRTAEFAGNARLIEASPKMGALLIEVANLTTTGSPQLEKIVKRAKRILRELEKPIPATK